MRNSQRLVALGVCAVFMLIGSGCGPSGPQNYPVTGTVDFDGKPLPSGDIIFYPVEPGVTPEAGKIVDGKYTLKARAGDMKVDIQATRDTGKTKPNPPPAEGSTPIMEMYIPETYNTKTILKATVNESQTDNQIDFDLKSDGS